MATNTYEHGDGLPPPAIRSPVPQLHSITQALAHAGAYSAQPSNLLILGIDVVSFKVRRRGCARRAISLGEVCLRPFGDVGQWKRDERHDRVNVRCEDYELAIERSVIRGAVDSKLRVGANAHCSLSQAALANSRRK